MLNNSTIFSTLTYYLSVKYEMLLWTHFSIIPDSMLFLSSLDEIHFLWMKYYLTIRLLWTIISTRNKYAYIRNFTQSIPCIWRSFLLLLILVIFFCCYIQRHKKLFWILFFLIIILHFQFSCYPRTLLSRRLEICFIFRFSPSKS